MEVLVYPHRNLVYILYTKLCKTYTTDVYKINLTFRQIFAYIFYTKLKELWQLNFVYKMYRKVCWNVGCILYASILIYKKCNIRKTYIHNLYITSMQNLYTNNCQENGSLISTYFDLFVVVVCKGVLACLFLTHLLTLFKVFQTVPSLATPSCPNLTHQPSLHIINQFKQISKGWFY